MTNWDGFGKSKPSGQFRDPTEELDRDTVRKASGRDKSTVGRRQYSLTTRIPADMSDDVLAQLADYADKLNMYKNDVQLWCLLRGLEALAIGEEPETEKPGKRSLKL